MVSLIRCLGLTGLNWVMLGELLSVLVAFWFQLDLM